MLSTGSTAFFAHAEDTSPSIEGIGTTTGSVRTSDRASEVVKAIVIGENHRLAVRSLKESFAYISSKEDGLTSFDTAAQSVLQREQDAEDAVAEALQKTATRGTLTRLMVGNDFDHLNVLVKELDTIKSSIAALEDMGKTTTSDTDRAVLATQVQSLSLDQKNIERFVSAHDSSYGLFGWYSKMAAKSAPVQIASNY